jgi:predicted aspartyl protease
MRRAFLFIFFVFLSLGLSPKCQASDTTITFKLYRGYLIVAKCSVANQANLTAIIDTGTTETILDLSLVRRLSLGTWADSATSLTKDSEVQGVSIPDLQFGPVQIDKLNGIAMDLSAIGQKLGVRPDLVIGMDVLHRANFIIDYKFQVITFGTAQDLSHSAPLAPSSRLALIDSNLLGRSMRLQVDTGFNGFLLYGKRIAGVGHPVETGARVDDVAEPSIVHSLGSPEVRIGNWHTSHMTVSVVEGAPSGMIEFDGLLGPRLLSTRRLAFDFDRRMLSWD